METPSDSPSNSRPSDIATVELIAPDGEVYQLRSIGTNELCDIEEQLGTLFGQLMIEIGVFGIERVKIRTLRAFIRRSLVTPLEDDQVGALIDRVGFDGISAAINKLIVPAQVQPDPLPSRRTAKEQTH